MIDNAGKVQTQRPRTDASSEPSKQARPVNPARENDQATQQIDGSNTQQIKSDVDSAIVDSARVKPNDAEQRLTTDLAAASDPNATAEMTVASNEPQNDERAGEVSSVGVTNEFETVAFQQEATNVGDAPTAEHIPVPDTVPRRLGGYKLDSQLGKGGMGTVFRAKQLSLDRDVAIKILKPSLTKNPSFVSRFVREAYAVAQLVHHNVVQIYDIGSQGDVHYFSMELVKGDSLSGVLKRQRRLDCDTAAGYILQAARGLKFAHDQGMVHRDVKPANLMLDEHGIVKVADLGLVKLEDDAADEQVIENLKASPTNKSPVENYDSQITQLGVSVGTPSYMAPEQWKRSSKVDQRADIYSLGATFYVLVTGKLPFDGKTPKEVITKVITDKVIPPELIVKDIPKKVSMIVSKMIAKDLNDRYPDMGALISDLEEYLGVSSSGAFSPSERHVEILEKCVEDFNQNPMVKLRKSIFQGGLGLSILLFVVGIFFSPWFAMLVAGSVVSTADRIF